MLAWNFLVAFIVVFVNKNTGCKLTAPQANITIQTGLTAILKWDIVAPYNFLFHKLNCYKMKEGETDELLVTGVLDQFKTKSNRIKFEKKDTSHDIILTNIQKSDAGTYECFVECISAIRYHYNQKIELIVKDKKTGTSDRRQQQKKSILVGILVAASILVILIVVCVKKRYYKLICELSKKNQKTNKTIKDPAELQDPNYAEITDFQQNHYGELDAKTALCHEYTYVDPAFIKPKDDKKNRRESIKNLANGEYLEPGEIHHET